MTGEYADIKTNSSYFALTFCRIPEFFTLPVTTTKNNGYEANCHISTPNPTSSRFLFLIDGSIAVWNAKPWEATPPVSSKKTLKMRSHSRKHFILIEMRTPHSPVFEEARPYLVGNLKDSLLLFTTLHYPL
ncbi:hypothetical protein AVEN_55498-1 [Araneus ventricosus]|uniref:Uncharacterized protein n=1 Tax=Araneus ventricosus TaxID=182803 RepID=A0A4Y2C963_ARAVE|nr:hypothetical protein AVEN_55498-1 [Araneus ventricosus]